MPTVNKAQVIDKAFWELVSGWNKSPSREDLLKLLGDVFDEGAMSVEDIDAARWRLFEKEFGDHRAHPDGHVYFPSRSLRISPYEAVTPEIMKPNSAQRWRFECGWTEKGGNADTIPKFITYLLGIRRARGEE